MPGVEVGPNPFISFVHDPVHVCMMRVTSIPKYGLQRNYTNKLSVITVIRM